jgi:hypothetical protein
VEVGYASLALMNPQYLWFAEGMELVAFFIIGPVLAITITYRAWRGKPENLGLQRYGTLCATTGIIALLLFGLAKWTNADVRSAIYFLQLFCVLVSALLFGVCFGCGWTLFLGLWRWHQATRLPAVIREDKTESR